MQNNNIGVVQNFNQYHIELKNVAPAANMSQKTHLSPDDMKSLDRLVRQQQNFANNSQNFQV